MRGVSISFIVLWLLAVDAPRCRRRIEGLPEVSVAESGSASYDAYNLRAYVIDIAICPQGSTCVRADGVDLASELVTAGDPGYKEKVQKLRDSGDMMTVPISIHHTYRLKVGRQYLFSYRKGSGVIGATVLK